MSLVPCPVCFLDVPRQELHGARSVDRDTLRLVAGNAPGWRAQLGICDACLARFQAAREALRRERQHAVPGALPILPTALRLGAAPDLHGRGVTIAFLDAGFFAHPDLVGRGDRILRYVDVNNPKARRGDLDRADESSWHGMMTSVVACGDGALSGGFYHGLASEARLVLVKVGHARRIVHDDIRRGLEWVVRHRRQYAIRIVNVSCGGDFEASYLTDRLSQSVERATREGLVVCCAVGNMGHMPGHPVLPPGSAPAALTVGGLDDQNRLAFAGFRMYHSSYGPTIDGLQKPEVIAPGIFIAAPVLPGTPTADRVALLARLAVSPDRELASILAESPGVDPELDAGRGLAPHALRALLRKRLREESVVSAHYKHVDGTSFAAPIVSSVVALMLEANARLTPQEAKHILVRSARRIPNVDADRQGWGVVDAKAAVEEALRRRAPAKAAAVLPFKTRRSSP
ncbi:MAG TPA: S8 family serine peptidase [Vicinamibacteria bacterium]|nr:S8 family serine peptidase [Vicinamibacteria bacterium]